MDEWMNGWMEEKRKYSMVQRLVILDKTTMVKSLMDKMSIRELSMNRWEEEIADVAKARRIDKTTMVTV